MNRYPNAAQGLHLIFLGQFLGIVAVLVGWVPIVGRLLSVVSVVMELAGIYKASADDENYRGALVFSVIILLIGVVTAFLNGGFLTSVLSMVTSVLSLMVVYTVCNTSSNLLHSIGRDDLSQRGQTVIKIYAVCTVISVVCRVLSVIPIIGALARLVSWVASIVQVAGFVMYVLFLNAGSKVL